MTERVRYRVAALDRRLAAAAVAHRTITGLDGAYPPLTGNASWAANPGGRSRARFYTNIVIRGTTALADDPVLTLRPYVRNGSGGRVGADAAVTFTRPRLAGLTSIKLQKTVDEGANYTDYSGNVVDDSAATEADLSALDTEANGDWAVIGGPAPFCGVAVDMDASNVNANAATLAVEYWNGTAWAAVSNATDGTLNTGKTLAQDGQITWDVPSDWASSALNSLTAYWVRVSVSAALSANVKVEELDLLLPIQVAVDVNADGDDVLLFLEAMETAVTGTVAYSGDVQVSWR